jgi:hypothetical protein
VNSRGFTWSPFMTAWADNNWPNEICLAGPQVAAALLPSGWVETIGRSCGPDRSRNGGEALASVILLKVDGGEVVSHPSGWTDGICMPRGWPLDPDHSVRMENGQPRTALILITRNRMRRHGYSVLSRLQMVECDAKWRTLIKFSCALGIQREKDGIRRPRRRQYLTRV